MKAQCVMCGRDIEHGIVCDKCDRPRRARSGAQAEVAVSEPLVEDPFPKAPIVPFPLESTSAALTSIYEILTAAEVPAILLGGDRRVRFVADEARVLLNLHQTENLTTERLSEMLGVRLPPPQESLFCDVEVEGRAMTLSVIPLSAGAAGTVLLLRAPREQEPASPVVADTTELRQALRSVRNELGGIAQIPRSILQRLDTIAEKLANPSAQRTQSLREIYDGVLAEYAPRAEERKIRMQLDVPETSETWDDPAALRSALEALVQNSLQFVPKQGQIVLGLRFLEHRNQPSLIFFVMDNGPIVPEELREAVFQDGFTPAPRESGRTGTGLAGVRKFAESRGGQAWVESKTGKACTFFIRVPYNG